MEGPVRQLAIDRPVIVSGLGVDVMVGVGVHVGVNVGVGVFEGLGVKVFVGVGVTVVKNEDIHVFVGDNAVAIIIADINNAIVRAKPPMNQREPPGLPDLGGAMLPVFNTTKLRSPLNRSASMPKLINLKSRLSAAVFIQ